METAFTYLQIQLSHTAVNSFVSDLRGNGIEYSPITSTSFIMKETPKVKMAIQLVRERFGRDCVYITNAYC
jgi:hypothetical protein